jgi:hypothetical protein
MNKQLLLKQVNLNQNKMKPIKKLIYIVISIGFGIWLYHNPFPMWVSNTIVAIITAAGIYKELNKLLEDESKTN